MRGLFLAAALAACSTSEPGARPDRAPASPRDASNAATRAPASGAPVPSALAPLAGHLDDDDGARRAAPQMQARPSHPIDVVLRSTPPGAQAAVDGVVLGPTPAYWNGTADGREHEFTFVSPGHALARYRFVPITSGTVHARLTPLSDDSRGAGAGTDISPPQVLPDVGAPDAPLAAPTGSADPNVKSFGPMP